MLNFQHCLSQALHVSHLTCFSVNSSQPRVHNGVKSSPLAPFSSNPGYTCHVTWFVQGVVPQVAIDCFLGLCSGKSVPHLCLPSPVYPHFFHVRTCFFCVRLSFKNEEIYFGTHSSIWFQILFKKFSMSVKGCSMASLVVAPSRLPHTCKRRSD